MYLIVFYARTPLVFSIQGEVALFTISDLSYCERVSPGGAHKHVQLELGSFKLDDLVGYRVVLGPVHPPAPWSTLLHWGHTLQEGHRVQQRAFTQRTHPCRRPQLAVGSWARSLDLECAELEARLAHMGVKALDELHALSSAQWGELAHLATHEVKLPKYKRKRLAARLQEVREITPF